MNNVRQDAPKKLQNDDKDEARNEGIFAHPIINTIPKVMLTF